MTLLDIFRSCFSSRSVYIRTLYIALLKTISTMKYFYFLLLFLFLGCQSAEEPSTGPSDPSEPELPLMHDQFYFTVSEEQLAWIYESRDTTYDIVDPTPVLTFNEEVVEVKKMKTRGTSASRVRRKSFNLDTEIEMTFEHDHDDASTESKDMRLLAMVFRFMLYRK